MTEGLLGRSVLDWPMGVTLYRPEKCYNGYTVVVPYRSEKIFLVDMTGHVAHVWNADPERQRQSMFMELLPDGNWLTLNYGGLREAGGDIQDPGLPLQVREQERMQTEAVELDWDGNAVWRYASPEDWKIHHDFARLSNGNTLLLAARVVKARNVSERRIEDNLFFEVTPAGEVVWEWSTAAHYEQFHFSDRARALIAETAGDCFHTNTLEVLPGNELGEKDGRFRKGNILSCQRHTNVIYIVDRQSGNVVWQWGQGQLVGPHHPTMLANGNILIYDNGGWGGYPTRRRFYTRLLEIDPRKGEVVWEYRHEPRVFKEKSKFFSYSWGSVQRLPNGNTFSLDCHKGRLFEVTAKGEIVWEYISPFEWNRGTLPESGIYRAYRYGYEQVPQAEPDLTVAVSRSSSAGVPAVLLPGMGLPPTDLP